jgi:hypothetical protein
MSFRGSTSGSRDLRAQMAEFEMTVSDVLGRRGSFQGRMLLSKFGAKILPEIRRFSPICSMALRHIGRVFVFRQFLCQK